MAIHVALHHKTHYKYDRLVNLGPQTIRLRPAPHARTRILSYSLRITPEQHFINWMQDPQANYAARLKAKQSVDRRLWRRHVEYLNQFLRKASHVDVSEKLNIANRLTQARKTLAEVEAPAYLEQLTGTLGAEPIESYL